MLRARSRRAFDGIDFTSRQSVLTAARNFEDLGVAGYNGAGADCTSPTFSPSPARSFRSEARHAAAIRDLLDRFTTSPATTSSTRWEWTGRWIPARCSPRRRNISPARSTSPAFRERHHRRDTSTLETTGPKRLIAAATQAHVLRRRHARHRGRRFLTSPLRLEFLEAEFYTAGVGTRGLIPADMMPTFDQIRKHEVAHVQFLQGVLGGRPSRSRRSTSRRVSAALRRRLPERADVRRARPGLRRHRRPRLQGQAANLIGHTAALGAGAEDPLGRGAPRLARCDACGSRKDGSPARSRGDLPEASQGTYAAKATRSSSSSANRTAITTRRPSVRRPLTKGAVLAIVKPFIAGAR